MKKLLLSAFLLLFSATAHAGIVKKSIDYKQGDTVLAGTVVYDDSSSDKRPGVLVVHQWMGPTEHEVTQAEKLAKLGYVAFVADIYGKGVRPKTMQEATEQAGKYRADRALLRKRVAAGLETLRSQPMVEPKKVAAIGYCFGGGAVLELARSGADLPGVVSFHGNLDTPNPDDAKNIKARLLVLHGDKDPHVGPDVVAAFAKEMVSANVYFTITGYPDAVHAFTQKSAGDDPSKGVAYNAKAAEASWKAMLQFFDEIF